MYSSTILKLIARLGLLVNTMPSYFTPLRKSPGSSRGWVEPTLEGYGGGKLFPPPGFKPWTVQPILRVTMLPTQWKSIISFYDIKSLNKNTNLRTQAYSWWIQDGHNSFSCNLLSQGWKNIFNAASNEFTVSDFIFCSINFCIFHILLQIFHSKHLSTFLKEKKRKKKKKV